MSAWMTGISQGVEIARQRAAQQQQAQEMQFRQQQANINNAQQDRAFDQQQQYQNYMRQMREMEYADRKSELARKLKQDEYDGQIFKAAAQPDLLGDAPGGVGPVQPHPLKTITDDVILGASPAGRSAYLAAMQRNAGFSQRRNTAARRIEMARADGTLKYMSDKDLEEFTTLGLLGELAPDEMPMSLRKQQDEQREKMAQFMAVRRTPDGELVSDPEAYATFQSFPPEVLRAALSNKLQMEQKAEMLAQGFVGQGMDPIRAKAEGALYASGYKPPTQRAGVASPKLDSTRLRALQDRYRALTGKGGKNGPLLPPTAEQVAMVQKANEAIAGGGQPNTDTGWFDFSGPDPEDLDKAQQQVALWSEMQGMLQGTGGMPTTPASDEPGMLDGPQQQGTQLPDEGETIDALVAEGLTADEIEARMKEMGYK